jgi:hypothetical protein
MIVDVSSADVVTVYQAIVGVMAPRPIAWVTTIDEEGRVKQESHPEHGRGDLWIVIPHRFSISCWPVAN